MCKSGSWVMKNNGIIDVDDCASLAEHGKEWFVVMFVPCLYMADRNQWKSLSKEFGCLQY